MGDKKDSRQMVNILLLGASGVGKSTLINAIIGKDLAPTGEGHSVTKGIYPYETSAESGMNLRLLDSRGIDYGIFSDIVSTRNFDKWNKKGKTGEDPERSVHMIWYCIDTNAKRVYDSHIKVLENISKEWKKVPIIIVFTKAFQSKDYHKSKEMIKAALSKRKGDKINIQAMVPVVALEMDNRLDGSVTPPDFSELIDATNALIPESLKIAKKNIRRYQINEGIKTAHAKIVGLGVTAAGIAVVNSLTTIPDSAFLEPLEKQIVDVVNEELRIKPDRNQKDNILTYLIDVGLVTGLAQSALKVISKINIPPIKLVAAPANALVAGIIVIATGETYLQFACQVAKGKLKFDDSDKLKDMLNTTTFDNVKYAATQLIKRLPDNLLTIKLPKWTKKN